MDLIVFEEKHCHRYFAKDPQQGFLPAMIKIIKERVGEEGYYEGDYQTEAQYLIEAYQDLAGKFDAVNERAALEKRTLRFLGRRSDYEYEGMEIVSTEE